MAKVLEQKYGIVLKEVDIQASKLGTPKKVPKSKLKSLLNSSKKYLKPDMLATRESAKAFLTLLEVFKEASKDDLIALIKDKKHRDIL